MQKVSSPFSSCSFYSFYSRLFFTCLLPPFHPSLTILYSIALVITFYPRGYFPFFRPFTTTTRLLVQVFHPLRFPFCTPPSRSTLLRGSRLIPYPFYYDDSIHWFTLWASPWLLPFHHSFLAIHLPFLTG